ncbi:hypothetical protein BVC80_209g148 [Macleaya cordata]|uniref:Thionin-like protein 2 n=1 Tax=Macleaya cordata TaxID=56857 RepID=A0A200QD67_MACCD|nr:hypothetical protein BVC80_209g148 [Macleaya cordata]
MEGNKSVKPIAVMLITVLVLGMFVGQTTADFKSCYTACFLFCAPFKASIICGAKCLKECLFPSNDLLLYCNLDCATSACTSISTPQDPRADEVEGCVNSCSDECAVQKY